MDKIDEFYMSIITPPELVEGMSYDDFCDWVEMGKKEFIEDAIVEFRKYNLIDHVKIMKIILRNKSYKNLDI